MTSPLSLHPMNVRRVDSSKDTETGSQHGAVTDVTASPKETDNPNDVKQGSTPIPGDMARSAELLEGHIPELIPQYQGHQLGRDI